MTTLYVILYLLAAIVFVLAAFNVRVDKINLIGLGLFFFVLVPFLQQLNRL